MHCASSRFKTKQRVSYIFIKEDVCVTSLNAIEISSKENVWIMSLNKIKSSLTLSNENVDVMTNILEIENVTKECEWRNEKKENKTNLNEEIRRKSTTYICLLLESN